MPTPGILVNCCGCPAADIVLLLQEIKHLAKIALVDRVGGRRAHSGFGAECDAQSGSADHGQIVRAIAHGNRLIMLYEGRIVVDVSGEEKKRLTVEDLLGMFEKVSGEQFASDRALLS